METNLSQHISPLQYRFLVFKNSNLPRLPLSATMTPKAITSALAAAQALFLPIDGQPSDNNFVRLSDAILPILLKSTYYRVNGVHNLWGLFAGADCYLHTTALPLYTQPPVRPVTTRQSTRKLLVSTAFVPKLPGLLYSKTMRPTRLLSTASRSSLRP